MKRIPSTGQLREPHNCSWSSPPETLTLGNDEVHVWRAPLDLGASRVQSLRQTLSADEQARAERFRFRIDRDRFIVARGTLRAILGRYLMLGPSQLRFCYSPQGKPAVAREFGDETLRFNVSHSHGLALYALTRHRAIGVDLERKRPELAEKQIAERFFSSQEIATLHTLSSSAWEEAFFACWTRKEAYIKALGKGLSLPLDQFEVSLRPGEPAEMLNVAWDPEECSRWSLQELFLGPSYAAALCVEGHGWQLKHQQWTHQQNL